MTLSAEATYINTGHPDFIPGHKAMGIVTERVNAQKSGILSSVTGGGPGGSSNDPRNPPIPNRQGSGPQPPPRDPQLDLLNQGQQDGSFFSSFFAKKKKPGVLENPPAVLKASGNLSEREYMETEVIKLLLLSYYAIVKRTVADLVPKAIMFNLVTKTKEDLQRELLSEMYKKEAFDEALKESDQTVARRKECKEMIAAFQKADEIIASVN
ncbi:vacuolar protein sorting-associated protein 1 [Chytriomyces hyalinus]|nr:vacuolar protein sorting-associated protein 1 [Chytriomyces hyalinus]